MVRAQIRSLRTTLPIALLLLLAVLAATPAQAVIYHVALKNGTTIDTLYEPQEASWDHGMVLVLTDVGNWMGVEKANLASVTSDNATRGFGIAINATTISLGDAPNDLPEVPKDVNATGLQALQSILQQQQQEKPSYTIQQGVQTEDTQGIPASLISPSGSSGPSAIAPIIVPPPTPPQQQ